MNHGPDDGQVLAGADLIGFSVLHADFLFDPVFLEIAFVELNKKVTSTYLLILERNRYSVPAAFGNRAAGMREYADRIALAAA